MFLRNVLAIDTKSKNKIDNKKYYLYYKHYIKDCTRRLESHEILSSYFSLSYVFQRNNEVFHSFTISQLFI